MPVPDSGEQCTAAAAARAGQCAHQTGPRACSRPTMPVRWFRQDDVKAIRDFMLILYILYN